MKINIKEIQRKVAREEFKKSRIADDLIDANLVIMDGEESIEWIFQYLTEDEQKKYRLNGGGLNTPTRRKYQGLIDDGGWRVKNKLGWSQIKPFTPRLNWDKKKEMFTKPVKYESPLGERTSRPYLCHVPRERWEKIAAKYNIPITDEVNDFWDWVEKNQDIPIVITEGAKKALALLSCNIVAIGISGVFNGHVTESHEDKYGQKIIDGRYLHQDLKPFFAHQKGRKKQDRRKVAIAFDQDNPNKKTTLKNVRRAIFTLGQKIAKAGSNVFVWEWLHEYGKGIDDVLVRQDGVDILAEIIGNQKAFPIWITQHLSTTRTENSYLNARFLPLGILKGENEDTHKSILIKSPHGTGKTQVISEIVENAKYHGIKIFSLSPTESLAKAQAKRFNIPYRTDSNTDFKMAFGYTLCLDSLRKKRRGLDPEELEEINYIVILDEVEQLMKHAITGTTDVMAHRIEILNNFQMLLENADRIIGSDADITNFSIRLIKELGKEKVWLINNGYKHKSWDCRKEEKRDGFVGNILHSIRNGEKQIIMTSGQKPSSKLGTIVLEKTIKKKFPNRNMVRIDSETIKNPDHPAYNCLTNLNEFVVRYNTVIVSPCLITGVSIETQAYFDRQFCANAGQLSPTEFFQFCWRLRDDIPRHLYYKDYGVGIKGNGSQSPEMLLKAEHNISASNINKVNKIMGIGGNLQYDRWRFDNCHDLFVEAWGLIAARHNAGVKYFGAIFEYLLQQQGHKLQEAESLRKERNEDGSLPESAEEEAPTPPKELSKILEENKDEAKDERATLVSESRNITTEEYTKMKQKQTQTEQELGEKAKYEATKKYAQPVTKQIALDDQDGVYRQLKLFYYLMFRAEKDIVEHDKEVADHLSEEGKNTGKRKDRDLFTYDFSRQSIQHKISVYRFLGLDKILKQLAKNRGKLTDECVVPILNILEKDTYLKQIQTVYKGSMAIYPNPKSKLAMLNALLKPLGIVLRTSFKDAEGVSHWKIKKVLPAWGLQTFSNWAIAKNHQKIAISDIEKEAWFGIDPTASLTDYDLVEIGHYIEINPEGDPDQSSWQPVLVRTIVNGVLHCYNSITRQFFEITEDMFKQGQARLAF